MALYTWRGIPAQVTDANAWSPTGLPGPNDVADIAQGTAFVLGAADDTGINYVLGNTSSSAAPNLVLVGRTSASVDLATGPLATYSSNPDQYLFGGPSLYANVISVGSNTLNAAVGGFYGDGNNAGYLTVHDVGALTGNFNAILGELTFDVAGTLSGTFNVHSDLDVQGTVGQLTNAVVNDGEHFNGPTQDATLATGTATIGTAIGPNVTLNVGLNEAAAYPIQAPSSLTIAGAVTSSSDVINLNYGALGLNEPITFMHPPPEQINVNWGNEANDFGAAVVSFNTDFITAASWQSNLLDLTQANGQVMPLHINAPNSEAGWGLVESPANSKGLSQVQIGNLNQPEFTVPPGDTVIHPTFT